MRWLPTVTFRSPEETTASPRRPDPSNRLTPSSPHGPSGRCGRRVRSSRSVRPARSARSGRSDPCSRSGPPVRSCRSGRSGRSCRSVPQDRSHRSAVPASGPRRTRHADDANGGAVERPHRFTIERGATLLGVAAILAALGSARSRGRLTVSPGSTSPSIGGCPTGTATTGSTRHSAGQATRCSRSAGHRSVLRSATSSC